MSLLTANMVFVLHQHNQALWRNRSIGEGLQTNRSLRCASRFSLTLKKMNWCTDDIAPLSNADTYSCYKPHPVKIEFFRSKEPSLLAIKILST
jgi:hypothetical protein